jgi:formylglycine-generating enzyme required for sulfatase activity
MKSISTGECSNSARCFVRLFLALCFWGECGVTAHAAALQALVIGNGAYSGRCRVATPTANARAMAGALNKIGFGATPAIDVDELALRREINEFAARLQAGDSVFLYYSGLAIQTDDDTWLLPVDYADKQLPEVDQHGYGLGRILDQLDEHNVKSAIVVLDASRACPDFTGTQAGVAQPAPTQSGLLLALSARAGGIVSDPADGGVNPFTSKLIENLSTHGLTPEQVFSRTQAAISADTNRQNIPVFVNNAVGDFLLTGDPDPVVVKIEHKAGDLRTNPNLPSIADAWIPPGSFQMGCVPQDKLCKQDESPRHAVTITQGFWMTSTEITLQAYMQFLDANPSHKGPRQTKTNHEGLVSNSPQTNVTWQDAQDYCAWAGGASGRLPTEAEWEYAARGGKEGMIYPWGNEFDPDIVNSYEKSKKKGKYDMTTPVDHYNNPNGFRLLGMAGNAREWTQDVYNPQSYQGAGPFVDPLAQQGLKNERVVRGGDFNETAAYLRASARDHRPADSDDNRTGFRCISRESPQVQR